MSPTTETEWPFSSLILHGYGKGYCQKFSQLMEIIGQFYRVVRHILALPKYLENTNKIIDFSIKWNLELLYCILHARKKTRKNRQDGIT
jgi:hypothetical protein